MINGFFHKKLTGLALGLSVAIGLAAFGAVTPANAQAKSKPAEAGGWTKNCHKPKTGKIRCITATNVIITKPRKQRIAGVAIFSDEKAIRVVLPLGTQLLFGYTFRVDKNEPLKGLFSICRPDGCHSELKIKDEIITQMKKGENLHLIFVNHKREKIDMEIPLAGFTRAYDSKPAKK